MAPARRSTAVQVQPVVRAAIYCRKSTSQGLDQDFNSLDAQRESAESYIASQRHENWVAVSQRYDDGGYSGGTTERPALKQLLADVEAGLIDCIVVYKYDRLSRSMLDFLQLLDSFKRHGVSFVSVSQRFDTSSPVGEMTLNILLSFAQFERQIIAERTRDKMRAARRRGRWTGGRPPLGYDTVPEGGRIIVNRDEADQVRAIFDLYIEIGSIMKVVEELNRRGSRQKTWTTKTGKYRQGQPWTKNAVHRLVTDPIVAGMMKLGDETFPGEHKGIVPKAIFKKVQGLIAVNGHDGGSAHRNQLGFLLRGLLRCSACNAAMTPDWTRRRSRLYRYYRCCRAARRGTSTCPTRSVAAGRIEDFVINEIKRIGSSPDLQRETFDQALAQLTAQRRGLRAEAKRLERDLNKVRGETQRLVGTLTRSNGAAATAVQAELEKAQERVGALEGRQAELRTEQASLDAQQFDEADLAQALEAFDPIWDVLFTPEKEHVLRQLVHRIEYDGGVSSLSIQWRLHGFDRLVDEMRPSR